MHCALSQLKLSKLPQKRCCEKSDLRSFLVAMPRTSMFVGPTTTNLRSPIARNLCRQVLNYPRQHRADLCKSELISHNL